MERFVCPAAAATEVWEKALTTKWHDQPVWVDGDVSVGNLLVQNGQLVSVIDFGQLAIGDPACDLAIAWTLWKALIIAAGITSSNAAEAKQSLRIIDEVLADYNKITNQV